MCCGAYDYEPFMVYGNDVPLRSRRRPASTSSAAGCWLLLFLVSAVELIEFDEFNMRLVELQRLLLPALQV